MTQTPPPATTLPHHKLFAYGTLRNTRRGELCLSLVKLVAKTRIADAQLRAQARKSAASAALNCAEGAARQTRADKSRAYAIALCECCGDVITAKAHLEWIARKLGPLAFSNPTLFISSLKSLGFAEGVLQAAKDYVLRSDRMKVLCSKCRRSATIEKF